VLADEIYDQMTYDGAARVPMATLVHESPRATLLAFEAYARACGPCRLGSVPASAKAAPNTCAASSCRVHWPVQQRA
jgi:hypothetical protein